MSRAGKPWERLHRLHMAADGDRASPHIGGESPALNPTTCYHIGPLVPEVIPDVIFGNRVVVLSMHAPAM